MFWYSQQTMIVRWGDVSSGPFNVSNGVCQGGILSPFVFNVYMDELSSHLNICKTGYIISNMMLYHIIYADYLIIFCSYSGGMEMILKICEEYGIEFDIKYNSMKSNIMIIRSKEDKDVSFPTFYLKGEPLNIISLAKHLGNYIADDFSDKDVDNVEKYMLREICYLRNSLCIL